MYPEKIRIPSPLCNYELLHLSDQLSSILGDSSLLCNIALLYTQGVLYHSVEDLQFAAVSFGDAVSSDMLYEYRINTGLKGDELRRHLTQQVYYFITECVKYFTNNPLLRPILATLKQQGLYITVNRVSDDICQTYIDTDVRRGV